MKALRKIEFVLACATGVMIPLSLKLMPYFIFLWGILLVVTMGKLHKKPRLPMLGMFLLFALLVVGMAGSEDMPMARKMLEFKTSLALFPLFHFISRDHTTRQSNTVITAFAFSVVAFALFSFSLSFGRFVSSGDFGFVGYDQLALDFHPTYLSMYVSLAGMILLDRAARTKYMFGGKMNHYVILLFLFVYLGFLGSKAGLGAGIGVLIIAFFQATKLKLKLEKVRHMVFTCVAGVVLVTSILAAPTTTKRIETALNTEVPAGDTVARNSSQVRILAWESSWKLIMENPLGVGTGDSTAELNRVYKELGETYALKRSFNSHNQFLQVGVEHGWPAMLILLAIIITSFRWAWKWKDWVYGGFVFIAAFNMMFESVLEVQAGVVFLSFFLMIFQNRRPDYKVEE